MNRRDFLKTGIAGAASAVAGAALAQGWSQPGPYDRGYQPGKPVEDDPDAFIFARFRYQGHRRANDEWDALPRGDENFLRHLAEVTNIKVSNKTWEERVVRIDDFEKMYSTPFLFMTGEVDFHFEPDEVQALDEYFRRGGFLYADDCDNDRPEGLFFYDALCREVSEKLPDLRIEALPYDHDIYHCFYDLPADSPWDHRGVEMRPRYPDVGMFYKDRMVCFLTPSDQHCAWAMRRRIYYNEALQMGTNIVVYALSH